MTFFHVFKEYVNTDDEHEDKVMMDKIDVLDSDYKKQWAILAIAPECLPKVAAEIANLKSAAQVILKKRPANSPKMRFAARLTRKKTPMLAMIVACQCYLAAVALNKNVNWTHLNPLLEALEESAAKTGKSAEDAFTREIAGVRQDLSGMKNKIDSINRKLVNLASEHHRVVAKNVTMASPEKKKRRRK